MQTGYGFKYVIERVDSVSILGLTLDCSLKWHSWIKQVEKKCKKTTFMLRQIKLSCASHDLETIFRAVLLPNLLYGFAAWCNASEGDMMRLQRISNHAARMCGVEALNLRREGEVILRKLFTAAREDSRHPLHCIIPPRSLRNSNLLLLPRVNKERLGRHFAFTGAKMFNSCR